MERHISASVVVAVLMHCRESLRELYYNVWTTSDVDVLGICGRKKLELLNLHKMLIETVDPNFHRFPCLKSLYLIQFSISSLALSVLITACPNIETLDLVDPEFATQSREHVMVKLSSSTLKTVVVKINSTDNTKIMNSFMMELDNIQYLELYRFSCDILGFNGKRSLEHLSVRQVFVGHLKIGEAFENLEILDTVKFQGDGQTLLSEISKASKLWKFQFWSLNNSKDHMIVDLKTLVVCHPEISHLSLGYEANKVSDDMNLYDFEGCSTIKNVVVLEYQSILLFVLDGSFIMHLSES